MSSHFDADGAARMVDVSAKAVTVRTAVASASIVMSADAAEIIREGKAKKGDVLAVARLAAISGSKWTSHLIPLCHAIPIEAVAIDFEWSPTNPAETADGDANETSRLWCRATVRTSAKTGVEMEALTAVSVAALAVYDMMKSVDRKMVISEIQLDEKTGGKSGVFRRDLPDQPVV